MTMKGRLSSKPTHMNTHSYTHVTPYDKHPTQVAKQWAQVWARNAPSMDPRATKAEEAAAFILANIFHEAVDGGEVYLYAGKKRSRRSGGATDLHRSGSAAGLSTSFDASPATRAPLFGTINREELAQKVRLCGFFFFSWFAWRLWRGRGGVVLGLSIFPCMRLL